LTGLTDDTLYHYRVISKDAAGNTVTSADFTFATDPAPTPSPTAAPSASVSASPSPSPTYTPTATVSAVSDGFSQSATLWNAALTFFGIK
jgi:hypothetical protein